jgi:hypothetical protein
MFAKRFVVTCWVRRIASGWFVFLAILTASEAVGKAMR